MFAKLFFFEIRKNFTCLPVLLMALLLAISSSGVFLGSLKYKEINLVNRGNEKVVQITNSGSFFSRVEKVLERSYKYTIQESETKAKCRFIFAKIVDIWPITIPCLLVIYGYYHLLRESKSLAALLGSGVNPQNYYWVKLITGGVYWFAFLLIYGLILSILAKIVGGLTCELFYAILAAIFFLWIYTIFLWAVYLLIYLLNAKSEAGYYFLVAVLVLTFFIPILVQAISHAIYTYSPTLPYLTESPRLLAVVPEKLRSVQENSLIESDLQDLMGYRQAIILYLTQGFSLEQSLAYFSPALTIQYLEKAIFWPELTIFKNFLTGQREELSQKIYLFFLQKAFYLVIINLCIISLSTVIIGKIEIAKFFTFF